MLENSNQKDKIDIAMLFIGWFLGIISSLIINKINKLATRREIKKGIISEIKEIQLQLVAICFVTTTEVNKVTKEWANWFRPFYNLLTKDSSFDYLREKFEENFSPNSFEFTEEKFYEFLVYAQDRKQAAYTKTTPTFAKLELPYLDSKYNSISLFKESFQRGLLKLRKEIMTVNNDTEQIWYYHTKTFEKLSDANYGLVISNINQIVLRVSNRTKAIIKLIEELVNL